MRTWKIASYENDLVTVNIEYDETTNPFRVTGVRVVNNGSAQVYAALIRTSDQRLYATTFPSGETYIPISTKVADRVGFTLDARMHYTGVSFQFRYPA
jgi:hypothetical protein